MIDSSPRLQHRRFTPWFVYTQVPGKSKYSRWSSLVFCLAIVAIFGCFAESPAATNKSPVLLSQWNSTRAVALESVTLKAEPFPLNASIPFSSDHRTRIAVFAMNLELLSGEGANAFSADVQDAFGKIYSLKIEYVGRVPAFEGITMLILRLSDDLGDVGDVLLRINLHGMSSNRVRVAIGHMGGGPADDPGAIPTPAPATPPPPDPTLVPDSYTGQASDADTVRLLEQATWGATMAEIARVKALGLRAFLNEQFTLPATGYPTLTFPPDDQAQGCPSGSPPECNRDNYSMYPIQRTFFTNALTGQDQLRQRVAFAFHQILVVSGRDIPRPSWMTTYLQALDRNAFGNFRTLLRDITLTPAMGEYLDMRRSTANNPNENFAREILQLFSIGVNELNLDGTSKLDAQGVPIPSYSQTAVNEFTRVLTGWNFAPALEPGVSNYRDPMIPRGGSTHDTGTKSLLNGVVAPSCTSSNAICAQQDLEIAIDNLFNHPNVGPFIGKQLIQHLVTSNPSGAYVERVARVFNNNCDALYADNCTGARGDLRAVVQAILLDPEARGDVKTDANYGRLREPIQLMNNVLRAFDAKSFDKTSTSDGVLASRGGDFPNTMDQPLFLPATVFSYYQPDYVIPGTTVFGPAFGILSTSTTLRRANFVNTIVYSGIAPTTTNSDRPRGTSLDLAPIEALASNPEQVLNRLNTLLLHGAMTTEAQNSVSSAISAIPTTDANHARKRAQVAVYLVATSSQFDIQR